MDFKGMLVSVGFSMAKIPIPPLMLLEDDRCFLTGCYCHGRHMALAARKY